MSSYLVSTLYNPSVNPDSRSRIEAFCRRAETETDNPAIDNIRFEGWEENPASLMRVIDRGRFDEPNGILHVLDLDEEDVCVAGAYKAEFDPGVALIGVRAWTMPDHRSAFLLGDHILPAQLDWAIEHDSDIAMFTFAPYNAWLAKLILRASRGRALAFGQQTSSVYTGWVAHPVLCRIQNTEQIVLYKQLGVQDRIPELAGIATKTPAGV